MAECLPVSDIEAGMMKKQESKVGVFRQVKYLPLPLITCRRWAMPENHVDMEYLGVSLIKRFKKKVRRYFILK